MTADKVKQMYSVDDSARQLLIIQHKEGSTAMARYYIKSPDWSWWLLHRGTAYIGKNGVGKTREGDAKTPLGELRPRRAFGILPDPGSLLPYTEVTPGTIACDEDGPFYNRIVQPKDYAGLGCTPKGEKMWLLSPEYDYGLETDYNSDFIFPVGSAIFVHCKGEKTWTGGCIALDKRLLQKILRTADAGLRIYVL